MTGCDIACLCSLSLYIYTFLSISLPHSPVQGSKPDFPSWSTSLPLLLYFSHLHSTPIKLESYDQEQSWQPTVELQSQDMKQYQQTYHYFLKTVILKLLAILVCLVCLVYSQAIHGTCPWIHMYIFNEKHAHKTRLKAWDISLCYGYILNAPCIICSVQLTQKVIFHAKNKHQILQKAVKLPTKLIERQCCFFPSI